MARKFCAHIKHVGYMTYGCNNQATVCRNGVWYCKEHSPENKEFEQRKRRFSGDMLEMLERLSTSEGVPVGEVEELVKKVRGGYENS